MTKLTNAQSETLSKLAVKIVKQRKFASRARKLKAECDALVLEIEAIAKEMKNMLSNGEHAVTFKMDKGGGYVRTVKKWRKYRVEKIIKL